MTGSSAEADTSKRQSNTQRDNDFRYSHAKGDRCEYKCGLHTYGRIGVKQKILGTLMILKIPDA